MRKLLIVACYALLGQGCSLSDQPVESEAEAITIAAKHLKEKYRGYPLGHLTPHAIANDRYWLVRYMPPVGTAGGDRTVLINRRSRDVVVSYGGQ